jgi:hypothetical protein
MQRRRRSPLLAVRGREMDLISSYVEGSFLVLHHNNIMHNYPKNFQLEETLHQIAKL